jgi:RNA polymerase sigma-70 factor, ECF subfamily
VDRDQLVTFVAQDYSRVVTGLSLVCGDRGRAEDAVQDVLAASLDRGDAVRDVPAFVTAAGLNRLRSGFRRLGAERRAYERLARRPTALAEPALEPADEALRAAVRALPRRQREAVVLHHLLDLSVEEVAVLTGVTAGTVKTSLSRGREALRRALGEATTADLEVGDAGR